MKIKIISCIIATGILFGFTGMRQAANADNISISGDISVVEQATIPTSQISKTDLAELKQAAASEKGITVNQQDGSVVTTIPLSNNNLKVVSGKNQTTTKNGQYTLSVDSKNPQIMVETPSGEMLEKVTLSSQQLQQRTANISVVKNLLQFLNNMNKNMDMSSEYTNQTALSMFGVSLFAYPGQKNGHRYHAGVHVQCNDFNGPYNKTHKYWSRKLNLGAAVKDFIGSDCSYHMIAYKCGSPVDMKCHGLRKHPTNCSSFKGSKRHWPKTLWWQKHFYFPGTV